MKFNENHNLTSPPYLSSTGRVHFLVKHNLLILGITRPSSEAQRDLLTQVYSRAKVDPKSVNLWDNYQKMLQEKPPIHQDKEIILEEN